MNRKLILTLTLIIASNCASRSVTQVGESANRNASQVASSAIPAPTERVVESSSELGKKKDAPAEFARIDFANLTYPVSWKKKSVTLKDGKYEYPDPKDGGGDDFELNDVYYSDLNGDGKKEAIVDLFRISCGGSCDGGSHLFYFYSIRHGELSLLWRISPGSIAYECGLKSFVVNRQKLTLEVFHKCEFNGLSLVRSSDDKGGGKFIAKDITRFTFRINGREFALEKSEVFPNEHEDVINYGGTISVSDE